MPANYGNTIVFIMIIPKENSVLDKAILTKGKALSAFLFINMIATITLVTIRLDSRIFYAGALLSISLFLAERLLSILNKYVSRFNVSPNFTKDIRYARKSLIVAFITYLVYFVLFYFLFPSNTGVIMLAGILVIVQVITGVCGIIFFISFLLAGKCLVNLYRSDHDERFKPLGNLMYYWAFFPVAWCIMPLLTFLLFNKD